MWLLPFFACVGTDAGPKSAESDSADSDSSVHDSAADTADTDVGDTGGETGDSADPVEDPVVVPPPPPCSGWGAVRDIGALADPERDEVSGVAVSRRNPGVLWVQEDHGGEPALYAIDYTGAALGTFTLTGAENMDWEDIALAPCGDSDCLWIADLGDNDLDRTEANLYRVPEPTVGWGGGLDAEAVPDRFPITWEEGNVNVEAMVVTPDGVPVLLSKRGDGSSRVYVVDTLEADVPVTPRRVGTLSTWVEGQTAGGYVTAADMWPDGSRLLVRSYERAWEVLLTDGGVEDIDSASVADVPFPNLLHVEGLGYDSLLRGYWTVPEGVNATINFTACQQ